MWTRSRFRQLFTPPVVGMIHLLPLPGSPRWSGDMKTVLDAALGDAEALAAGGVNVVMIENFHDVPFHPREVPPETVAAMSVVVQAVATGFPGLKIGVNVLRNDARAALAVAAASGASFIRVNVHTGTAHTDQGTIEGRAWYTLRRRRELGLAVGILADFRVKHARPAAERPLAEEVRDLRSRGLADGVIVSGSGTGAATDPKEVAAVREVLPDAPVLVGSGVRAETVAAFRSQADGFIVGTSLQETDSASGYPRISRTEAARIVAALD